MKTSLPPASRTKHCDTLSFRYQSQLNKKLHPQIMLKMFPLNCSLSLCTVVCEVEVQGAFHRSRLSVAWTAKQRYSSHTSLTSHEKLLSESLFLCWENRQSGGALTEWKHIYGPLRALLCGYLCWSLASGLLCKALLSVAVWDCENRAVAILIITVEVAVYRTQIYCIFKQRMQKSFDSMSCLLPQQRMHLVFGAILTSFFFLL